MKKWLSLFVICAHLTAPAMEPNAPKITIQDRIKKAAWISLHLGETVIGFASLAIGLRFICDTYKEFKKKEVYYDPVTISMAFVGLGGTLCIKNGIKGLYNDFRSMQ